MKDYFVSSMYNGFFTKIYMNHIIAVESMDTESFLRIRDRIFEEIKESHHFARKDDLVIISINKIK